MSRIAYGKRLTARLASKHMSRSFVRVDGQLYAHIPWSLTVPRPPENAITMWCDECGERTWAAWWTPKAVIEAMLYEHQRPHVIASAEQIIREASTP